MSNTEPFCVKSCPKTDLDDFGLRRDMKSPVKKIELIANVAIIIVALLLGIVLVRRNFLPQRVEHIARKGGNLNIGERVQVSGID